MSNSETSQRKVRLIAEADEGTEIFVIDGRFRLVASALKHMETELPPGLYTVKFKRGAALAEVDADLLPGTGPVRVQSPEAAMAFESAAPIDHTATSHEYHQAIASQLSRRNPVPVGWGQGSWLFLFVRDVGVNGIGNPAEGMTLHDPRGHKVVDFGKLGETGYDRDTSGAAWYGCHITLAPGFYRLRVPRPGRAGLEQALILVPDWQVQVFLLRNPLRSEDLSRDRPGSGGTIDLSDETLFMVRPDRGFDPKDPSVRLTDLVRKGLASGRIPVTEDDLRQLLERKFENPMLGLFGAHLLAPLLAIEPSATPRRFSDPEILSANRAIQRVLGLVADGIVGPQTRQRLRQLLEIVTGNLETMLGNHPDVHAIRHELSGNGSERPIAENAGMPPMLRRSWDKLVRSDPQYHLAKAGSILARIADRTWGVGPWLIWQVPPAAPGKSGLDRKRFRHLVSRLSATDTGKIEQLLQKAAVSPIEESILRHSLMWAGVLLSRKAAAPSPRLATDRSMLEKAHRETAKLLGIPVMTLKRSLVSAMAKIDAAAGPQSSGFIRNV